MSRHESYHGGDRDTRRVDWRTPALLADKLRAVFDFDLDVAASAGNTLAKRFYTEQDDALVQPWDGVSIYCNPPYDRRLDKWVQKALSTYQRDRAKKIVMLVPMRPGTGWWWQYVRDQCCVVALRGKLQFDDSTTFVAPFYSALLIYDEFAPRSLVYFDHKRDDALILAWRTNQNARLQR